MLPLKEEDLPRMVQRQRVMVLFNPSSLHEMSSRCCGVDVD